MSSSGQVRRRLDEHIVNMMGIYLFEHRRTSVKVIHLVTFWLSGTGIYSVLHSLAPTGSTWLSPAFAVAIGLCLWGLVVDGVVGVAYCVFVGSQLLVAVTTFHHFGTGGPFWGGLLFTAAGVVIEGLAHFAIQRGPPAAPLQVIASWSLGEFLIMPFYFVFMFGSYFLLLEVVTLMGRRADLRALYLERTTRYIEGDAQYRAARAK